jgi:hypothetical protein
MVKKLACRPRCCLKTPTGKTGERDDQGELFEAEFQPGSGSWDPMLGLALTRAQGRWSVDGNALYTIATEGTQHTDLGDRFHYNGAVTYRLKGGDAAAAHDARPHSHNGQSHHHDHAPTEPLGPRDRAVLDLNGEWQAKQDIAGETDPNSGGNVVFISPGVRVASNSWSGFVTVGLPIVNDLNGLQSEPTYRLFGGVWSDFEFDLNLVAVAALDEGSRDFMEWRPSHGIELVAHPPGDPRLCYLVRHWQDLRADGRPRQGHQEL